MRGYGKSDRPQAIDQYTLFHLVGDMVGLLDALQAPTAVIAGHDWGRPVAWHAALLRPDRFRAVIGLSVPFRPRADQRPTSMMPKTAESQFYQLYFQKPGVAEAELERDPGPRCAPCSTPHRETPGGGAGAAIGMVPLSGGFLQSLEARARPAALARRKRRRFLRPLANSGARRLCRGSQLGGYRNIDRNWELMAPFAGAQVKGSRASIASGDRDLVVGLPRHGPKLLANLKVFVPQLSRKR